MSASALRARGGNGSFPAGAQNRSSDRLLTDFSNSMRCSSDSAACELQAAKRAHADDDIAEAQGFLGAAARARPDPAAR